ncbi:MAG: RNA polymerase sigma factor [Planctomycetes bacterium]|nr:RNA polymerase sigma factor [Planctomycetota bacterium]
MATTTAAQNIVSTYGVDADGNLPEEYWQLVERYRGELVNQALSILGDLADAEDVVQESFCEAFRNPERLAKVRSLGAWLRQINRANALNRARGRSRDVRKNERRQREAPPRLATTGGLSLIELRDCVTQAIEHLPAKQRAVVVMRFWQQRSYEEIASALKLPEGTVGRLLFEATQQLFGRLQPHLSASPSPNPQGPKGQGEAS